MLEYTCIAQVTRNYQKEVPRKQSYQLVERHRSAITAANIATPVSSRRRSQALPSPCYTQGRHGDIRAPLRAEGEATSCLPFAIPVPAHIHHHWHLYGDVTFKHDERRLDDPD